MRCPKQIRVHTEVHLRRTTSKLILIQVGRDHKDSKVLPYNTIVFSGLDFETTD